MKSICLFIIALLFAIPCLAQQTPADAPATKEDIEKYFEIMHVRANMKLMMDSSLKQTRQMVREQMRKQFPDASPEFMAQMDGMMNDMLNDMPLEEFLQAMVPVYQRHLTKGDLDAILAFYATPAGQKLLNELPAMTQESMQASFGVMQKRIEAVMQKVRQRIEQMQKDEKAKSAKPPTPTPH